MIIPYCEDKNTLHDINYFINIQEMLDFFKSTGNLEGDTYAEQVTDMCNFSTAYLISKLQILTDDFTIHEGVFGMIGNHTWVQIGDVIIDPTLQQFLLGADRLSVIDATWNEYHSVKQYTPDEWFETSPNLT